MQIRCGQQPRGAAQDAANDETGPQGMRKPRPGPTQAAYNWAGGYFGATRWVGRDGECGDLGSGRGPVPVSPGPGARGGVWTRVCAGGACFACAAGDAGCGTVRGRGEWAGSAAGRMRLPWWTFRGDCGVPLCCSGGPGVRWRRAPGPGLEPGRRGPKPRMLPITSSGNEAGFSAPSHASSRVVRVAQTPR